MANDHSHSTPEMQILDTGSFCEERLLHDRGIDQIATPARPVKVEDPAVGSLDEASICFIKES